MIRVDRVDRDVDAVCDVAPDCVADRARPFRRADHRNRTRKQDPSHCSRVGALLASFDAVEELIGVGEFPVEVDHTRVETTLQRPPGLGEHREHRSVVAEDLGREAFDAVRTSDRGEVFEQQGGDAGSLLGVVDHERSFCFVAAGPPFVARPRDELVVRLDSQCGPVDHVDVGEMEEFLLAQLWFGGEEPSIDALGRLTLVELGEGWPVVGGERADEHGVAVAEDNRGCPRGL